MNSSSAIVVLEDDPWRSNEMRRALHHSVSDYEIVFFDNAHELCDWMDDNLSRVSVISLDRDLDLISVREMIDVGSGEDVVSYLVDVTETCPIIIHSSNAMRAPAMHMDLVLGGWKSAILSPYNDAESWVDEVVRCISESRRDGSKGPSNITPE